MRVRGRAGERGMSDSVRQTIFWSVRGAADVSTSTAGTIRGCQDGRGGGGPQLGQLHAGGGGAVGSIASSRGRSFTGRFLQWGGR